MNSRIFRNTFIKKTRNKREHENIAYYQPEDYFDLIEKDITEQLCKKDENRTSFICLQKQKRF